MNILLIVLGVIFGLGLLGSLGYVIFKGLNDEKESNVTIEDVPVLNGKKKALLIGINHYENPSWDLSGCLNDVDSMKALLIEKYGFGEITTLKDAEATRQGIIEGICTLVNDSKPGDELVLHFSGHGSQIPDYDNDEMIDGQSDYLDEILCPFDIKFNESTRKFENIIKDDTLAGILKGTYSERISSPTDNGVSYYTIGSNGLNKEAILTFVCDSCHSGTMTRTLTNRFTDTVKRIVAGVKKMKPRILKGKAKVIPYPDKFFKEEIDKLKAKQTQIRHFGIREDGQAQRHVLFSGCKDDQYSSDAYIDGKHQGAFTWALTSTLKENPNLTYEEALYIVRDKLSSTGYSQIPQLSGMVELTNRKVFGGNA